MSAAGKPVPVPTPDTAPYWAGCRDGKLLIQHCADCGRFQFYPRAVCAACLSQALQWHEAAGGGRVKSFTIIRRPVSEAYADEVPYVVALIELDEGPAMMSNVVDCDPEAVAVGMTVSVTFEAWTDEISVPKFRPA